MKDQPWTSPDAPRWKRRIAEAALIAASGAILIVEFFRPLAWAWHWLEDVMRR